jgi:hypothetical protein
MRPIGMIPVPIGTSRRSQRFAFNGRWTREDHMTRKTPERTRRLSLSKKTLKDLEPGRGKAAGIRGGAKATVNPGCPPPPTMRCQLKTTVPSGCAKP